MIVNLLVISFLLYRYRQVRRHNKRLKHINAELAHMSQNDQLSGIGNRYLLHQEMKINRSAYKGFSIMIMNLDHFKKINDVHSHEIVGQVIKEIVLLLTAMIREQDLVGCWGGEELLIICRQMSQHGAMQLDEEIRNQIEEHAFAIVTEMSISIGVSEYLAGENIKRVDDALYEAKHLHRNQTVLARVPVII